MDRQYYDELAKVSRDCFIMKEGHDICAIL